MKRIWNMLCGRSRRDDRGMTLVETVCAVAILALVAGVIGTVIVVSTRTYRKGISETGIQQEAQLAANNIGNLVKDACGVVYGESGLQFVENGDTPMTDNSTGLPKMQTAGFTELSIITNDKVWYTMTYDDAHSTLMYQEFNEDGSDRTNAEIMANNIVAFKADTTDFRKSKTIKLNMTVKDLTTNREIPMEYTMTSRNDAMDGFEYVAHTIPVALFFPDDPIVLVPGETYNIPIVVSGDTGGTLEWESVSANIEKVSIGSDYAEVKLKEDTTTEYETITVRTKDMGSGSTQATCTIKVRRVNSVGVSHSVDTTNATGHMLEAAGAVYTFSANVSGYNLGKNVAYDYDKFYKIAQATVWSCVLKVNGTTTEYNWTASQNPSTGAWEFVAPNFTSGAFDTYFEVDTAQTKEDALFPSFTIKLKKALPSTLELTVRATSKHALGVNKAISDYGTKDDTRYWGEDTIKPRETKMNQGLEVTLEPLETSDPIKIGMKGGITSDVTFAYHDASDERNGTNTNGTIASYDEATDSVVITLGKNEKGTGPEPESTASTQEPYTFFVDVKADGEVKTTITVHVCRIDVISVAVIDNYHENKNKDGKPDDSATYDFRARFNTASGDITEMQGVTKNLIQYKADGTLDAAAVKRTLSSKITWEVINRTGSGNTVYTKSVICKGGTSASDKGEVIGSYDTTFKAGGADFQIVDIKPARVEGGVIKQLPEIDIKPMANTETGLPKNYELKVTIRSLHPSGMVDGNECNKAKMPYIDSNVEASASVYGDVTIKAPADLVIVEPGQGVNDTAQSDREMVIPLEVSGGAGVYKIVAEAKAGERTAITGNTSSETKLCSYSSGNPYAGDNATSGNNSVRTWYLGLLIGEDEMGDYNGRIQIHVVAYNSTNVSLGDADITLGVRRVDSVNVQLSGGAKFSTVNKEGGTMTIDAFPKGRGNNGTEFYDMQKDNSGNARRWEQKGHGEYKEPSPMEWKMLIKGTEKPLSAWTEYFEADSIKTSVNESDHKATVTFKLKKAIPIGTKIRAYSLHAQGMVGDTKYNKSEKKYAGTYGELRIEDDGFQRADEFVFVENIANMRQGFGDYTYDSEQCSFYRYRIKNGTWTPYYQLDDKSPTMARFVGPKESLVFMPENDYDLEIINVVYSKSKKLIYWPLEDELLQDGRGWKEEGFRLWNGDEIMKNSSHSGSYKDQMIEQEHKLYEQIKASKEQWKWNFDVPKININFEIGNARQWKTKDTSVTLADMKENRPIHLQGGSTTMDWIPGDEIAVELAPTSFCLWKKQYHMNAYVDQKVGGQWKEVAVTETGWDAPSPNGKETYWHLQTSCPQFQIYQVYCRGSAEYRIRTMIKDMEWMKIEGRLFDRTYVGFTQDTPLFDMSNGDGVLYLRFN